MSSLAPVDNYSTVHMGHVLTTKVAGFLGVKDTLVNYIAVDRRHRANLEAHGVPVASMTISVDLANALFAHIQKFPKLEKLKLESGANRDNFNPLVIANGPGKVSHLLFSGLMGPGQSSQRIQEFLQAIPNLKGIGLFQTGTGTWGEFQFRPIEGERISEQARANMGLLTDLDLSNSNIDPQAILEILQGSTTFKSVKLTSQSITPAILSEIIRSPELAHLDLSYTYGEVDYAVLANCHTLESFTPASEITEEALIAIIAANPNLTKLDLSQCKKEALTDLVLQAIAANLSGLMTLKVSGEVEFTDAGFLPLIQGCKELTSLSLGNPKNVSPASLVELKQCSKLTELRFSSAELSDSILESLATMTELTALSLAQCSGFSDYSLMGLQTLVSLEKLNLDGIRNLSDDVIATIVNHCPKLDTLRINAWGAALTEDSLIAIETAIREKRTDLKNLSCAEAGPGITYQMGEALTTRLRSDGFFQLNANPHTSWR